MTKISVIVKITPILVIVKPNNKNKTNFSHIDTERRKAYNHLYRDRNKIYWIGDKMGYGKVLKTYVAQNNMTLQEFSKISTIPVNTLYSITKRDPNRISVHNELMFVHGMRLESLNELWDLYEKANNEKPQHDTLQSGSPFKLRVCDLMDQLNQAGQRVAVDRIQELTEIPKYQLMNGHEIPLKVTDFILPDE